MAIYIRLIRPFIHIFLIISTFFLVYKFRDFEILPKIYQDFYDFLIFLIIISFIFIFIGYVNGLYELKKTIYDYYKKLLKTWFIWFIFIVFVAYIGIDILFKNGISRIVIFIGSGIFLLLLFLFDFIINLLYDKIKGKYKVLVVYKNDIYKNFLKLDYRYHVEELLINSISEILRVDHKGVYYFLKDFDIIFLLGDFSIEELQIIFDASQINGKMMYNINDFILIDNLIYNFSRFGSYLAIEFKISSLDGRGAVFKRLFDIIFSLLFIIFFFWLYILISLYIYLKDGRPIIYKSLRVGRGGKLFYMYKFRTMVKNADELKHNLISERDGPLFKIYDDPRIKPWGKFLRKYSLDEIPQFFNVLKGDMSIVGPRPHLPNEVQKYKNWQRRLLSIKPGITGYAQIFGRHNISFEEEAKYDLYYIQNWSFLLDLYIIIMTLKVLNKGS